MELYVDIQKDYGSFRLRVRLETREAITGLLGASGSGKSLTLKCIAGLERPDRGLIRLNGRTLFDSDRGINLPPQQRRVGYLFQSYALFPHMTVEQNIRCGLHRDPDPERRLRELVAQFQLQGLERHKPRQLSGGQAQRVALARILGSQPELLLLDEPFSALDAHLRDQLQPQTHALLKELGIQTLLVTHSRDEAYRMCSDLGILENGRMIRFGSTREVFSRPGFEAAARLTGCKNLAPALRLGIHRVGVPLWGMEFTTRDPVPENLKAIGIRAHGFRGGAGGNACPVRWVEKLEEPFGWTVLFRFAGQSGGEDLWWRLSKDAMPPVLPDTLWVSPEEILLLEEEAWND